MRSSVLCVLYAALRRPRPERATSDHEKRIQEGSGGDAIANLLRLRAVAYSVACRPSTGDTA